jgi:cell division protein FtsB
MKRIRKIKTEARRKWYVARRDFLTFNNISLLVAFVACAGLTLASIGAMTRNWSLSRELEEKRQELEKAEVEVETLELEKEYYASEEYQEIAAKKYLGKAAEDEKVLVLPKNSEYARTKYADIETTTKEKTNFELWMSFILGI